MLRVIGTVLALALSMLAGWVIGDLTLRGIEFIEDRSASRELRA